MALFNLARPLVGNSDHLKMLRFEFDRSVALINTEKEQLIKKLSQREK
jgi:hypothetical protein